MKAQVQTLGLMIGLLISSSAFAGAPAQQKPATRIDFNKMIEDNNDSKQDLTKSMKNKMDSKSVDQVREDKKKVLDFVDVEIGLDHERPIVDRRFNSVSKPRLVEEVNVQLLRKKHIRKNG